MSDPTGEQLRPSPSIAAADDVLRLDLTFDALYTMRATVAAHAAKFGLTEPKLGGLLVVVTELAANTVRHGGGSGTLSLWRDGNAIRCQVSDDGPGIPDPETAGTRLVPLNSDGGRGLWLIRQLTDDLAITNHHPGSTITVTLTV